MEQPELIRIKASAGAGKTYRLALRYLSLLKRLGSPSSEKLRSIVAITFTNKAAAEMKERILKFLKEIAFETEDGARLQRETGLTSREAKAWVDTIVANYSDFQVRTIDSFLFALFKGLSFELGVRPDAEVRFDHRQVFQQAWDLLVSEESVWEAMQEALSAYLHADRWGGFYPEGGLKGRIENLLSKTIDKKALGRVDLKKLKEAEEQVKEQFQLFISALDPVKHGIKKNTLGTIYEKDEAGGILVPKDLGAKEISELLGKAILRSEVKSLFTKGNCPPEPKVAEIDEIRRDLILKLRRWQMLRARHRVQGYLSLIAEVKERMDGLQREEGIVLGGEWTRAIRESMESSETTPFVQAIFDSGFRHFLFDEFQDTSREQWEALLPLFQESLSQKGSLFLVGDVKQAIYRWRGGDWTLFDEVVSERSPFSVSSQDQTLPDNFRSHPELVDFFNDVFGPLSDKSVVKDLFSKKVVKDAPEQVLEAAAEEVSKAFSGHEQTPRKSGDAPATVEIYRCSGSKEEMAGRVRALLEEKVEEEWQKRKDATDKTPIAVLVRTREQAREVSGWLLHRGIPVVTEDALQLGGSAVVVGLLSLLRHLHNPEDENALYGFLASGLMPGGPSSEEELASRWKDEKRPWDERVNKLVDGVGVLVNRQSPYELLQAVLESLNLHQRLQNDLKAHRPFVERLLEVTHSFESREGASLGRFLEFWDEGGLEEQVGLPENIQAVRVLTIHKAKGLEFPVVFVPFTNWGLHHKGLVDVHQGHLVALGSPRELPPELQELRARLLAKEAQELLNLFYVAVTRAEEALYLFLTVGKSNQVGAWAEELIGRSGGPWKVQELN